MSRVAAVFVLLLGITLISVPAWAADATTPTLTDMQIEQVRQNCTQAQSVLQRLQSTDVATRINRGRIYENLLNNLVTPLNDRVSANHFSSSSLSSTANSINQKFTSFKNDYSTYEDSFSSLISMKCQSNPKGFYTLLVTTRDQRAKVATDVTDMNTLIGQYSDAVNDLQSSLGGV